MRLGDKIDDQERKYETLLNDLKMQTDHEVDVSDSLRLELDKKEKAIKNLEKSLKEVKTEIFQFIFCFWKNFK